MKSILSILFVFMLFIGMACQSDSPVKSEKDKEQISLRLDLDTFKKKLATTKNPMILDVRTAEEFAGGALEGAINADFNGNLFDKQMSMLNKSQPTFIYCQAGGRSAKALRKMRKMGFVEVYELESGYGGWKK